MTNTSETSASTTRSRLLAVMAIGGGVLGLLAIALFGATQGPIKEARAATPDVAWDGIAAVLETPAQLEDTFPTHGKSDPVFDAVVPGTSRFLGETDVARYWAAAGAIEGREVCLITELIGTMTSASCVPTEEFLAHGVGNQTVGLKSASRAYFVPDTVQAETLAGAAVLARANLIVMDPEIDGDTVVLEANQQDASSKGLPSTVELRPFEAADRNF